MEAKKSTNYSLQLIALIVPVVIFIFIASLFTTIGSTSKVTPSLILLASSLLLVLLYKSSNSIRRKNKANAEVGLKNAQTELHLNIQYKLNDVFQKNVLGIDTESKKVIYFSGKQGNYISFDYSDIANVDIWKDKLGCHIKFILRKPDNNILKFEIDKRNFDKYESYINAAFLGII